MALVGYPLHSVRRFVHRMATRRNLVLVLGILALLLYLLFGPDWVALPTLSPATLATLANLSLTGGGRAAALRTERYEHIPFDRHVGRRWRMQVNSAAQDHRSCPVEYLAVGSRPWAFPDRAPTDRVIQFHAALARDVTWADRPITFDRVELWVWYGPFEVSLLPSDIARLEAFVDGSGARLHPKACLADMPESPWWRYQFKVQLMDWVIRCLWADFDESVQSARASGGDAVFAVFAAKDVALFPLDEVLHYPKPDRPLETKMRNAIANGQHEEQYPTAPWRKDPRMRDALRSIKRTDDPSTSVGVWMMKKFSWNGDDDLWILWMLDIVGVDHIVINVATSMLSVNAVKEKLKKHPGVIDRVTLVALDAPPAPVVYDYMAEVMTYDAFLRWQTHFDYAFLIDADEFVQLFSPEPPFQRVDVKTFLARNKHFMHIDGQEASFDRMQVRRTRDNVDEEPLLPDLLCSLLKLDGLATRELLVTRDQLSSEKLQKSLFWVTGSVTPYLHYNRYAPNKKWNVIEGHMLHIREKLGVATVPSLLDQLDRFPSTTATSSSS